MREVDERRGNRDLELMSVSMTRGVIPRSELTDDEPRAEDLSNYKVCRAGDIVVNRMSAYQGALGLAAQSGIVSPDYIVFRLSDDVVPRWIHHVMRSAWFVSEMAARIRGIGSIGTGNVRTPRVSSEEIGEIRLSVPSRDRQQAIADYLDAETARIDALIAKKQRMIARLLELRAVATVRGVAGALAPSPQSSCALPWLESIPSHWRTAKLNLVAQLGSGHTPSRNHPEWWIDCTIPWVTTGEVAAMRTDRFEYVTDTRECISEIGLANSAAVVHPRETVVLCRTASAGYSAIMSTEMATSQDFATWTCGPLLRPRYLLLCLRAMRGDLLGRLAMGSTHKTIYMPDIEAIRIPLPPVEEQDEIVEQVWNQLRRVDRIVDATERQIDLLREHRQALITAAVTGELEVPGVET